MATNALNGAFKDLLDLFISVGSQVLVVLLQEVEVAIPEVHLACIVAERAFVDFLGLAYGLGLIALRIALLALNKVLDVGCHIGCIDWVFVANLFQYLHVLIIFAVAFAGLFTVAKIS